MARPVPPSSRALPSRRDALLAAAAAEFATHGLENASLNRILATAGVPKGVAYHHFEDKADLFAVTVVRALEELEGDIQSALARLDARRFWPAVAAMLRRPWEKSDRGAALLRAMRAVRGGAAVHRSESLRAAVERVHSLAGSVVQRGQDLGVVRTDLPIELLGALVLAVDDAFDEWLLSRAESLRAGELDRAVAAAADALRRLLAPRSAGLARGGRRRGRPSARRGGKRARK